MLDGTVQERLGGKDAVAITQKSRNAANKKLKLLAHDVDENQRTEHEKGPLRVEIKQLVQAARQKSKKKIAIPEC